MNPDLLSLIEDWANKKGWWAYKNDEYVRPYINISKLLAPNKGRYLTLFLDGEIQMSEKLISQLHPADPEFFSKLETLVIEAS